jgi:hypothetical protein
MRTIPLVVATLLLASVDRPASAATPNAVAIAVDTSGLHPKFAAEVEEGIAPRIASGLSEVMSVLLGANLALTPVTEAALQARVLACEDDACLEDIAASAELDLVVRARVQPARSGQKPSRKSKQDVRIAMVVARPGPDRETWSETSDCHLCTAGEIKHTASLLASTIAERIRVKVSRPAPKAVPRPTPAPPPAPEPATPPAPEPAAPRAPALEVTPAPTPPPAEWYVPSYLSVTAIVGGLALAGSGLYLLHLHGEGTCDLSGAQERCPRRYDTRGAGIGLLAGGGAITVAGLAGLVFFSPRNGSSQVALHVTGSSISISGGF